MEIGKIQIANQVSKMNATQKTVNNSRISFMANVAQDSFEKKEAQLQNTEKKASIAKKIGVGLASFLLTGAGQAINGDWGKAVGMFAGATLGCGALIMICPPVGLVAGLALGIWSIVDAVKNAKP